MYLTDIPRQGSEYEVIYVMRRTNGILSIHRPGEEHLFIVRQAHYYDSWPYVESLLCNKKTTSRSERLYQVNAPACDSRFQMRSKR